MQKELLICANKAQAKMYQKYYVNPDEVCCESVNTLLHTDGLKVKYFGIAPALWVEAAESDVVMKKVQLVTKMLMQGRVAYFEEQFGQYNGE
ncbi:hypothetical protein [Schleiferilactobacillus perolens]|nr:hypothetical protein [Schleiferilactobacillus perolens]